jgi:hypothetical protein
MGWIIDWQRVDMAQALSTVRVFKFQHRITVGCHTKY